MDPDPDPDPALFFSGFQDANKIFLPVLTVGTVHLNQSQKC
jgi:hypothetical protein